MIEKKKFLTTKEAAEYLGVTLSCIYGYTHNNVIPYYRPYGRYCYFRKEDIDNFVLNGRISSQSEIDTQAIHDAVMCNKR